MSLKNEKLVRVTVEDLSHLGEGVAKVDGFPLFIPAAIPGDVIEVEIAKKRKNFGYATIKQIITPSPDRVHPQCDKFGNCGGCQTMSLSYEAQLIYKEKRVKDSIMRIGKINTAVSSIIGMNEPWYYRNKAQFPIGKIDDETIMGFYRQGSHEIVDSRKCYIQHPIIDKTRETVRRFINDFNLSVYNEVTGEGLIRHLIVKTGFETDEVMVIMVINGEALPDQDQLIEELKESIPGLVSVCVNYHTKKTNVIMGDKVEAIYGKSYLTDKLGQLTFRISPHAFFQVNPDQTIKLYDKAIEFANLSNSDNVMDIYCGIGTISLFAAEKAAQVLGIESVESAVKDARINAEINQIKNIEFVAGKAEEVILKYASAGYDPDVIIVDPPRKGCDEAVLTAMVHMNPSRIVYVSCNPATLARDLKILEEKGYKTEKIQPVDMFPHSAHVETVCLLTRK